MTHYQVRLMHGHVNKCVKMHTKPTGGTNKHGMHIIARSGKGNGMHEAASIMAMHPQMVTSKQGLMGIGCNHTTRNPLRVSNMVKPRTREANTSMKHTSTQA